MQTIGETFRQHGVYDAAERAGVSITRRDPSGDMLLDPRVTPSRAACEAALAALAAELRRFHTAPRVAELERQRRAWQERLAWNNAKDALAAGRPDGCWCLGYGSRLPLPQELPPDGPPAARIYCDACAAGRAAAAESVERGRLLAQETRQARLEAVLGGARVPEPFRALSLDSYRALALSDSQRRAADRLDAWLRAPGAEWLYLTGPTGTGKTALACIALRELMDRGSSGLFCVVPDLLDQLRGTFSRDADTSDAAITGALERADVLLLDDLGAEKPSEWVIERLYRLVNARHLADRRTLITSNLGIRDLGERIGDRTASRIAAHVRGSVKGYVKVDGDDLRMVGLG